MGLNHSCPCKQEQATREELLPASDIKIDANPAKIAQAEEDMASKTSSVVTGPTMTWTDANGKLRWIDLGSPVVDVTAPLCNRDIDLIQQTFAKVAELGANAVGRVLFDNIFSIAPGAKALFPFVHNDKNWREPGSRFEKHAIAVVTTTATAVSLLTDLPTLVPVLKALGLKHVGYGVIPDHYDVVGQALIQSLASALGENFTPAVKNAYLKMWGVVKETMLSETKEATSSVAGA